MSNMLKCPNPSCPYVFDPSQVPVGVVLSCPRCAMQFTLGAPAAPPPTTAALPPNFPPPPTQPAEPDFAGAAGTATQHRPRPEQPRQRKREPQAAGGRSNKTQVFILAGIAAVLMAGTALAIIFKLMRRGEAPAPDTLTRIPDINIGVEPPAPGWDLDDDTRAKVGSPYARAYKRSSPEAYVAFGSNLFDNANPKKGRVPRPSEMQEDLKRAFPKLKFSNMRYEAAPETAWLGEPIAPELGFKFRATSSEGLTWAGEAYAVAHKGIAYYWLSWCLENDFEGLKDEFASFRGRFKTLELRKDWQAAHSSVIDFKGDKVLYTLSDAEELWQERPTADEKEADLDKWLRISITPKRDPRAIAAEAELRVYLLDATGEPLEVARTFAEDKETERIRAGNPDFVPKFEPLADPEQGDPVPPTVPKNVPVVRLRSRVAEAPDQGQLIVASGLKFDTKIVVVRCWCQYSKRSVFETKLVQIASSLR